MAGNITLKTGTVVTVTSSGGSTTTGTATSAGDADFRAAGTANLIEEIVAMAELTAQWATTTSIAAGTLIGDLYMVPKVDGTNAADIDTTSGSSYIASNFRVGAFVSPKALTAATNYRFVTAVFDLFPGLFTVYLLNRSGQTISANWTLKILPAQAAYT